MRYRHPLTRPRLCTDVKQLVHFFREPTWIVPPRLEILSQGEAGTTLDTIQYDEEGRFSPDKIPKSKSAPDLSSKFVKAVEKETNNNFFAVSAVHFLYTIDHGKFLQLHADMRVSRSTVTDLEGF